MPATLIPRTFGSRPTTQEFKFHGKPKVDDYHLFFEDGPTLTEIFSEIPSTPRPTEDSCVRFRSIETKYARDYYSAIRGQRSGIKIDEDSFKPSSLEETLKIKDPQRPVTMESPTILSTDIKLRDYEYAKDAIRMVSRCRIVNRADIIFSLHQGDAAKRYQTHNEQDAPERLIAMYLYLSSPDLMNHRRFDLKARVYRKEMPREHADFVEQTVFGFISRYKMGKMVNAPGYKVFGKK